MSPYAKFGLDRPSGGEPAIANRQTDRLVDKHITFYYYVDEEYMSIYQIKYNKIYKKIKCY